MDYTGQTISHYHIVEKLGQGGMATVYRAYDTRLERDVAIKLVRKGAIPPEDLTRILQRFEREAKALAKFMHPNIVPVYDYGEYDGAPYLVMAYLPGGTLTQFLRERGNTPVSPAEASRMLVPIADALSYAHKRGVIHRDVKPSNMLITEEGVMMLSDFGIAKLLEEDLKITQTNMLVGTPDYMAPEQWLHMVSPASDQYALGVVFYEMITGQKPFHAETPAAIILKQSNEPLPRPSQLVSGIPEHVEHILFKALAKNPQDRYADMQLLKEALQAVEAGNQESTATAQPKRKTAVPSLRHIPTEEGETRDEFAAPSRPAASTPHHVGTKKESVARQKTRFPKWAVWGMAGLAVLALLVIVLVLANRDKTPDEVVAQNTPTTVQVENDAVVEASAMAEMFTSLFDGSPQVCKDDPHGCAVVMEGDTVKIGMAGPMLGDYAMFGQDISQGAMLAIKDYNKAGGLDGWDFELVAEDTGGAPEQGAAVASKFVTDETMVAIAGHIFSGETEAAIPIYDDAGFPMMSPSAINPPLTQLGSAVFNRLAWTDAMQAKFAAEMLAGPLGFSNIAVIHDGGAYGQGLADEVQKNFEALGGEVVAYEAITVGEADYSATLAAVAAAEPQAVYFGGYAAEGIIMMNQWVQSGLEGVLFFGCDGTYGVEFTEKTGENGIGAIAASLVPPDSAEKTAFDAAYEAQFGLAAGELSAFTWSAYDTAWTLIEAAKSVGFEDGGKLYFPRSAMVEAVRNTNYTGLTGDIICDKTGECNASGPTFYVVVSDGAGGAIWVPWTD